MADFAPSQFQRDMERRRFLAALATGLGGAVLAGCGSRAEAQDGNCPVTPTEIRGPFPADGVGGRDRSINVLELDGIVRRDITSSFAGMNGRAQGVPMEIELDLVRSADGCPVLASHAIYLWQCDASGDYSLYNNREVNYLRGLQAADASGVARFESIVPGCYGGRAPHLHLEVFSSAEAAMAGERAVLVSQLGLPEEPSATVYADRATYGESLRNLERWPPSRDWAFRGEEKSMLILGMSGDPQTGYTAKATVALA